MSNFPGLEPIDYLLVGHITQDLTPEGTLIGGTAAFSSRTAKALGMRVGVVTAWGEESGGEMLEGISIVNHGNERSTTFENVYTPEGRIQTLHHLAPMLEYYHIPELWRNAPIVHIAPVAKEVNPSIVRHFPDSQVFLTPQGWMRQWDSSGNVRWDEWPEARHILRQVSGAVLSLEDVLYDMSYIEAMAEAARVLVVTDWTAGATLYMEGQVHQFPAPEVEEVDPTGVGDIFAAAFFVRFSTEGDPIEAVRFANLVASDSATRKGLASAPSEENLYDLFSEVK